MKMWIEKESYIKKIKDNFMLWLVTLPILFVLSWKEIKAQTNQNKENSTTTIAFEKETNIENLKEILIKTRNDYIYSTIKNCKQNKFPLLINYGKYEETLKKYSEELWFSLPKKLSFDAINQEIILDNIKMKIEVPNFSYIYETNLGNIEFKISNFTFKSFRYNEKEDLFYFKADFQYVCTKGEIINDILMSFGLDKFLKQIPFSKKRLIELVKIATENELKTRKKGENTFKGIYDMQNEKWKHITNVKVTVTY